MKTHPEVAERLHALMLYDLLASEVYLFQSVMFRDWGYDAIAERLEHEADHERLHLKKQLDRLTYLDVPIDLSQRLPAKLGDGPRACLQIDLEMELSVAEHLNELCRLAAEHGDNGTRELAEELLVETEMDHILWLRTQLRLMDALGEETYLARKIYDNNSATT